MLLHLDGSPHAWFQDDRRCDLIVVLDDATNEVYYGQLVEEESTRTVMAALREVIERKGLFCALYSDRASHFFETPRAGGKVDPERLTQVGRALLEWVIDFTERGGYPALRLTQSALNLDSYSLYTRAGFVPRCAFQDMFLQVPPAGLNAQTPALGRVRDATLSDVSSMAELEMEVSGITREQDYRYAIENPPGFFHCSVYEGSGARIDGYMISSGCAMNMLGPCVARSEQEAAALILRELDLYRGRTPVFLIPVEREKLVQRMYDLGARNCELHFCQVRGRFQPFRGISMPTFLPETG